MLQGTNEYNLTEKIAAAPGAEQWEFSSVNVSSFFEWALTEMWHSRMYAPYYTEFWQGLHGLLENEDAPVAIVIDAQYHVGQEDVDTIKQMMQRWVNDDPNFIKIRQEKNGVPNFVHIRIRGFELEPLTIDA